MHLHPDAFGSRVQSLYFLTKCNCHAIAKPWFWTNFYFSTLVITLLFVIFTIY